MSATMNTGRGVKTSFQRKGKTKSVHIQGTRPSLHNNLLLVSTGLPSFDFILGGGLAVGSVLLIEEDTHGHYAQLLLRYFLAEGIMSGHNLFLASANQNPQKILKMLPFPVEGDKVLAEDAKNDSTSSSSPSEPMKIAWRYESLPKVQVPRDCAQFTLGNTNLVLGAGMGLFGKVNEPSSREDRAVWKADTFHQSRNRMKSGNATSHKFGHSYDLSRTATPELLSRVNADTFYLAEEMEVESKSTPYLCPTHQRLLKRIESQIKDGGFHLTDSVQAKQTLERTILRIALHSLGSPLWWDENLPEGTDTVTSLCRFLHALRALLRSSLAVAVITMPTHLLEAFADVRRLERLCDAAVQIESFAGSEKETNPIYEEYHGLVHIKQLPRLNSLTLTTPDTADLGFKLKRKKFTIEKLHLPPEFSDSASRPQEDTVLPSSSAGCSTIFQKRGLDF